MNHNPPFHACLCCPFLPPGPGRPCRPLSQAGGGGLPSGWPTVKPRAGEGRPCARAVQPGEGAESPVVWPPCWATWGGGSTPVADLGRAQWSSKGPTSLLAAGEPDGGPWALLEAQRRRLPQVRQVGQLPPGCCDWGGSAGSGSPTPQEMRRVGPLSLPRVDLPRPAFLSVSPGLGGE